MLNGLRKSTDLRTEHEESFKDVPRLSTIQAMILGLKAREAVPKRGYFYRSWMTVVNCVVMAKDLDLDTHFEHHQMGKPCGSSSQECITKTRVWHLLFQLEVMVGGPQGKSRLGECSTFADNPRPYGFRSRRRYGRFQCTSSNVEPGRR